VTGRAAERTWTPPWPLDLPRTLSPLRRGHSDPTYQADPGGAVWRTCRTPAGAGTVRISRAGPEVLAAAWGPGAGWLLDGLPQLLGADDRPEDFVPRHPHLVAAARRLPGLRFTRTGLVFDQVVPAILEQKVTGQEARRSWRELVWRFGAPAPGPAAGMPRLRVAPDAATLLALPDWEWHRAGVDLQRRRAIRAAATVAARLEECAAMPVPDAVRRLRSIPGIGGWTAAEVVQRALGAADEVSVGDFHLASWVGWALVGRPLDDAGMLELLAPYAPQRQRAVRLVELTYRPPRFGPRTTIRDYRGL
jgi:3-methyladenine DNA glycosylase/8-oxoguanine DNA glycosylase